MQRPLPHPTAETRPFWDGCAQGHLRYQRCSDCGTVQLIPRSLCASCQSEALQWQLSGGQGRVLTHTTVHRAPTPAFRAEAPYTIAIVDMDEGFRLMVNVAQDPARPAAIGARVRIVVREVQGMALPHAEVSA